ncbi:flagellar motor stator protein MotA [Limnobacter humi]|uniref:Flagellar motor stator protein MotA n=1 Tax=Limnobacter humi TaxID=1778671 RepID=A0ABT1WIP5_9BURK|nr:flagellar motor stator protein MotA [Limnobacter humi]MCQ8897385.1 flagellar motor stator protein MotA [Limnobacter humi]
MFVIVGYILVTGSVLGGFLMAGGHLHVLWQPVELVIIAGAAIGGFIVSNTTKVLKAVGKGLASCFKNTAVTREFYMSLMALMYEILTKVRKEGLMSIEGDVEEPEQSPLFQKYPDVLADHHIVEFMTDYLRLMVSGNLNPMEIEALMDGELETHHQEAHTPASAVQKMADGLPAFGIVAAVMGVVHVMGSVGQVSNAELGNMIAAALVGTFLGILLSYGFVGPLASLLEQKISESSKPFECVKTTLLASLNGYSPALAVEFGRKVLYSTERPTFLELESHVKGTKG